MSVVCTSASPVRDLDIKIQIQYKIHTVNV